MQPPFILTIGGSNAIDLNTGTAPVIQTLVTVITREMLTNGQPVYATPLTTMAFQMARHGTSTSSGASIFLQQLTAAAAQVETLFSIDQTISLDIFRSPVVINSNTVTTAEQKEAVYHRAALEAFATKVSALSVAAGNVSTDLIIDRLALDLESDGVIDNTENGNAIGAIDPTILSEDPMTLVIPNTQYRIKDVMNLMEDERTLLGTAATGPSFNKNQITLPIAAAPAIIPNSFPANLQGTAPEEATVVMNINKPVNVDTATITLSALDADFSGEGELMINGNTPVALFGPTATASNDKQVVNIPITTPASFWNDGDNTLVFRHTSTAGGFSIQNATVSFQVAAPVVYEAVITLSTSSIQFGNQDVGSVAGPKPVKFTNTGNAPLTISSISISTTPGFSQTNDCNNYLPVNSTCTFSISFT
ncbi:MAG TPA: hypothetical protein ENI67_07345, partial [Gammaproteobacteria bacterium]|nr:hypothetical protein [Gammaproteobacteria bacterium]